MMMMAGIVQSHRYLLKDSLAKKKPPSEMR